MLGGGITEKLGADVRRPGGRRGAGAGHRRHAGRASWRRRWATTPGSSAPLAVRLRPRRAVKRLTRLRRGQRRPQRVVLCPHGVVVRRRRIGRRRSAGALTGPDRFINRELSWLDFNDRVLALGRRPERPAARAGQVLAIFSQNLDEFFQVRVAGLKDQVAAGLSPLDARRPDALRAAGSRSPTGSPSSPTAWSTCSSTSWCRRWPRPASGSRAGTSSTRTTASYLVEVFERPDLPGAHPARRRPRPPLPVHLEPVAEPGRGAPRPGHHRAPLRPGEGAAAAAPLRGDARRRAVRAARAGHRRPPRPAVPGHGHRGPRSRSG